MWTSFNSAEAQTMFKKMLTNGTGRIVFLAIVLLAPWAPNILLGQALNMDSQSRTDIVSPQHNRFSSSITSEVDAENEIASPIIDKDPSEERTTPSRANAADSWGPVPTKKASAANL